jgi:hypothetical protein
MFCCLGLARRILRSRLRWKAVLGDAFLLALRNLRGSISSICFRYSLQLTLDRAAASQSLIS